MNRSRRLMSEILGRELYPEECVTHKDGNYNNLSTDNLKLIPNRSILQMYYRSRKEKEGYIPRVINRRSQDEYRDII